MRLFICLLLCPAAFAAINFNCPTDQSTGYFADPDQCDLYWDCDRGVATQRTCPDGLAFSEGSRRSTNPCVYHWLAGCNGLPLQPPSGGSPCTRLNGYFPHTDPSNCISYYRCADGQAELVKCAPGLIYDSATYTCNWADVVNRAGCEVKESVDGFTCPDEIVHNNNGLRERHPRYNDRDDCRSFFVCLEGVTPQRASCPLGKVFSEAQNVCTIAKLVPGCETYYRDHPEFPDANGDGIIDEN